MDSYTAQMQLYTPSPSSTWISRSIFKLFSSHRRMGVLFGLLLLVSYNILPVYGLYSCLTSRARLDADEALWAVMLVAHTAAGACLLAAACCRRVHSPARLFIPALVINVSVTALPLGQKNSVGQEFSGPLHCSLCRAHDLRLRRSFRERAFSTRLRQDGGCGRDICDCHRVLRLRHVGTPPGRPTCSQMCAGGER